MSRQRPTSTLDRFPAVTKAHSGVNPSGSFISFTNKDVYESIDLHRDRALAEKPRIRSEFATYRGKCPPGTTKCTYRLGLDATAKLDRRKSNFSQLDFPRNPTDNFSYVAL